MPAVVIDGEVAVGRHGKHDLRQQFLELRVLVPQFMAGVDREASGHPGHDGKR